MNMLECYELKSEESFSTQTANHLDLKDYDYETLISSAKQRISIPLKCTTLYIYEIESLFSINFYLQLFNYNLIIIIFKHLNFYLKYIKVLKTNIIQFLMLNFMEIKLTINYEFF